MVQNSQKIVVFKSWKKRKLNDYTIILTIFKLIEENYFSNLEMLSYLYENYIWHKNIIEVFYMSFRIQKGNRRIMYTKNDNWFLYQSSNPI